MKQIHCRDNLVEYTVSSTEIVGVLKSFQTDGKGKVSDTFHIITEFLVNQCTVCVAVECTFIVLLAQFDQIRFAD